jgi:hypothetical protein
VSPFIVLFFLITVISVVISGGMLLVRRMFGHRLKDRDYINSSVFSFFTTLYAFFIGFAIVTLWTAFLTTKANVNREADALGNAYRISQSLPHTEAFRQSMISYVKTVIEDEWPQMERDSMSQEAGRRFDDILTRFFELGGDTTKIEDIYNNLTEAGRQRLSRATNMQGNLYPPVWMILIFGFGGVVLGLYLLNRQQTPVSLIFEFMVLFMVLACLYFIFDIDTPFSGLVNVKPDAFQMVYHKMLSWH